MAPRAGIYIGYVGHKNLGDEAIWEVCKAEFADVQWSTWQDLNREVHAGQFLRRALGSFGHAWSTLAEEIRTQQRMRAAYTKLRHKRSMSSGGESAILGGGTLIDQSDVYLNVYRQVRKQTGRPIPLFATGVACPQFWSSRAGWVDRRAQWAVELAELPVVGVRGPMSKAYLEEVGVKNVEVAGDPAIRLHRRLSQPKQAGAGAWRIAINGGDISPACWGDPATVDKELAEAARRLRAEGHALSFISVCPEDVRPCVGLARACGLNEEAVMPPLTEHESFLAAVQKFDCVVSLKLHCGVLAAAASVPFVSLEYQPKCRDFALSLGWERFVCRTDEVSADWIVARVQELCRDQQNAHLLCQRTCELSARLQAYCAAIHPLLAD